MNADYFSTNAWDILTGASNYKDVAVWWFVSQPPSTHISVVHEMCALPLPPSYLLLLFQIMTRTFFLSKDTVTEIRSCLATFGSITPIMTVTQQSVCETINAFSPKCGAYFTSLGSNDKANLIGTICSAISSNRVPRANLQPTIDYYQSLVKFDSALLQAVHDSCDSGPALCSTSPQSQANFDWFKTQPLQSQITCILNICSNQTFATPSLANTYGVLDPTINTVTKGYETACLQIRDLSKSNVIARYYPNFNTTVVQVWFSSLSPDLQIDFIDTLYDGSYLTSNNNAVPILDLVQLNDTMNGLTSFLTTGYPASLDWVTQRVSSWQDTYNAFTYDQFMSSIGNMNNSNISPTSMIWFKAQNLTSQKQMIGDLCANSMTEAQKQLIFYFLAHYMAIGDSVYNTITECPAVINLLQPFKINIYFIIVSVLSGAGLVGVVTFILRNEQQLMSSGRRQMKVIMSPFNISLIFCLLCLVVVDFWMAYYWSATLSCFRTSNCSDVISKINLPIQAVQSLWSVSYIAFAFRRSEYILEEVWPNSFKLIKTLFFICPVFLLSPVVPLAVFSLVSVKSSWVRSISTYTCQAVAAIYLASLDAIFVVTFIQFIKNLYKDIKGPVTPKFVIISRFGTLASVLCVLFSINAVVKLSLESANYNQNSALLCSMISSGLMHAVTLVLIGMKVIVHQADVAEQTAKNESSNKIKMSADLNDTS